MNDFDIKNLNEESEDVLYFGDDSPVSYESNQVLYSEEDMYENYKPMTNTNSVEYDEGDYASPLYGVDREESEDNKNIIFGYIFGLLVIVLGIVIVIFII